MNFLPIYIIKMPGSKRNPNLIQSIRSLGLDFILQEAVVGNSLTSDEIKSLVNLKGCNARLGYQISKNLIGCALSHKKIYGDALKKNSDWILVFEEDAQLVDFKLDDIQYALSLCEDSPIIIQLFSRASRLIDQSSIIKFKNSERIMFDFAPRLIGFGASAYLINKKAILLSMAINKLDGPSDWPSWTRNVTFKGLYPWMIYENDDQSTIPKNNINHFKYYCRKILQLLGIHFLIYRNQYGSLKNYARDELIPFGYYIRWKLGGSKYYQNDKSGPQIINKFSFKN